MEDTQITLIGTIVLGGIINYLANSCLTELGEEKIGKNMFYLLPKKEYYTRDGWKFKQIALIVLSIGIMAAFISAGL